MMGYLSLPRRCGILCVCTQVVYPSTEPSMLQPIWKRYLIEEVGQMADAVRQGDHGLSPDSEIFPAGDLIPIRAGRAFS